MNCNCFYQSIWWSSCINAHDPCCISKNIVFHYNIHYQGFRFENSNAVYTIKYEYRLQPQQNNCFKNAHFNNVRVINTYRWNFKAEVCGFTKYINLLRNKQIKDWDSTRYREFFSFSEKFHGRSHLCYWQGFSAHHLARTLNQERCGSEIKCV